MTVLLVLLVFVFVPAVATLLSKKSPFQKRQFVIGAALVYRQEEASTHPTSEAHDIRPSARGEFYYYSIISYLRVVEVLDDHRIIAVARDNKRLCLWPNDSCLRKARLSERFIYRFRFPHF